MYKLITLLFTLASSPIYALEAGYDPTSPIAGSVIHSVAEQVSADLVLQSIIKNSQGKNIKAIINGKLVSVGDSVSIYKVKSITNGKAILSSPDAERTLKLFSQAVVNYK